MMYAMSQETPCHLDPEDLERYSLHQASEDEMARFEEHLLLCEPCREELRTSEVFATSMRAAAADWRQETRTARSFWSVPRLIVPRSIVPGLIAPGLIVPRLIPVFAALAVVVLGIVVVPRFIGSSQPPLAVSLTATRGAGMDTVVPAGRSLALTPDLTGLPAGPGYRLEIVDEHGAATWRGGYTASQGAAIVSAQRDGARFVRIYSSSGVLLREYGLMVGK